jgi:hypothetical protein
MTSFIVETLYNSGNPTHLTPKETKQFHIEEPRENFNFENILKKSVEKLSNLSPQQNSIYELQISTSIL